MLNGAPQVGYFARSGGHGCILHKRENMVHSSQQPFELNPGSNLKGSLPGHRFLVISHCANFSRATCSYI